MRGLLFLSGVEGHGLAHQLHESRLVQFVTFVEVDSPPLVSIQAGFEDVFGVGEKGSPVEGDLDLVLVGVADGDDAIVLPYGGASPFPFFGDFGTGLVEEFAEEGEFFASPVCLGGDVRVDLFGRAQIVLSF